MGASSPCCRRSTRSTRSCSTSATAPTAHRTCATPTTSSGTCQPSHVALMQVIASGDLLFRLAGDGSDRRDVRHGPADRAGLRDEPQGGDQRGLLRHGPAVPADLAAGGSSVLDDGFGHRLRRDRRQGALRRHGARTCSTPRWWLRWLPADRLSVGHGQRLVGPGEQLTRRPRPVVHPGGRRRQPGHPDEAQPRPFINTPTGATCCSAPPRNPANIMGGSSGEVCSVLDHSSSRFLIVTGVANWRTIVRSRRTTPAFGRGC